MLSLSTVTLLYALLAAIGTVALIWAAILLVIMTNIPQKC